MTRRPGPTAAACCRTCFAIYKRETLIASRSAQRSTAALAYDHKSSKRKFLQLNQGLTASFRLQQQFRAGSLCSRVKGPRHMFNAANVDPYFFLTILGFFGF
jgi:hypothetical protein